MGAKGVVLNHIMIVWKQTLVYFRRVVKEALDPSNMLGSGQDPGQENLFPQPGCDHNSSSCEHWQSPAAPREVLLQLCSSLTFHLPLKLHPKSRWGCPSRGDRGLRGPSSCSTAQGWCLSHEPKCNIYWAFLRKKGHIYHQMLHCHKRYPIYGLPPGLDGPAV